MRALILKNGIELKDKKVAILGSGGTSATAYVVSESLEAREIYRVSRREKEGFITYDTLYKTHSDTQIIINTTPCGMFPNTEESPIDIDLLTSLEGVVDAVYNPLRTKLVVSALNKGIKATGGLYMLVAQAVFAGEIFTGTSVDDEKTQEVYKNMVRNKENIVLTGMPGSGKSTIGKLLAEKLNMNFVDSDEKIVETAGMSIPDIFRLKGEKVFRDMEEEVIKELSLLQNTVIATGGGAVLRQENVDRLRRNGRIYFIDRALEALVATADRPLSSDREMLEKRFEERYDTYLKTADRVIKCSNDAEENAEKTRVDFER